MGHGEIDNRWAGDWGNDFGRREPWGAPTRTIKGNKTTPTRTCARDLTRHGPLARRTFYHYCYYYYDLYCVLSFLVYSHFIIITIIIIPTPPRIPPHHPSHTEERRGVMSLVGQLLKSLSCLVVKLLSVLSC